MNFCPILFSLFSIAAWTDWTAWNWTCILFSEIPDLKDYQSAGDEVIIDDVTLTDREDLSDFKFSKFAATYFTASVMHSYLRKYIFFKNEKLGIIYLD